MLAPREIGQEGFREGKVVGDVARRAVIEVGKELEAKTAVFVAPAEFTAHRGNKTAVKEFLHGVKKLRPHRLGGSAGWDPDEAEALAAEAGVVAARDPLAPRHLEGRRSPTTGSAGPRGTRAATKTRLSRSSPRLRSGAKHKDATYVFTNVDMFADAKRFKKAVAG